MMIIVAIFILIFLIVLVAGAFQDDCLSDEIIYSLVLIAYIILLHHVFPLT